MSRSKTCEHCVHFYPQESLGISGPDTPGGLCRRFPPMPMLVQQAGPIVGGAASVGISGVYPPVDVDNTCGEFEADTRTAMLDS